MMNGNMAKFGSAQTKKKVFIGIIIAAIVGVGAIAFAGDNDEKSKNNICSHCGNVVNNTSEDNGAVGRVKGWFNEADNVVKGWFGNESGTTKASENLDNGKKNKNRQNWDSDGRGWEEFYGGNGCDMWGQWNDWSCGHGNGFMDGGFSKGGFGNNGMSGDMHGGMYDGMNGGMCGGFGIGGFGGR